MTTKYDLGDRVIVENVFLFEKNPKCNAEGEVISILVTQEHGVEYSMRFFFPEGTVLQGEDMSSEEAVGIYWIKENRIIGRVD